MKNSRLTILMFLILSSSVFAEVETSTSSTVINTSTVPVTVTNGNVVKSTTVTTTTTTTADDDAIVSAVYAKYAKDPALIGTTLTVSSQNAIVTISGTVTAQAQADEAVIAAKSIAGVKDVRSNINVTTNPDLNKPTNTPPKY